MLNTLSNLNISNISVYLCIAFFVISIGSRNYIFAILDKQINQTDLPIRINKLCGVYLILNWIIFVIAFIAIFTMPLATFTLFIACSLLFILMVGEFVLVIDPLMVKIINLISISESKGN